jgi:hypothetical protein
MNMRFMVTISPLQYMLLLIIFNLIYEPVMWGGKRWKVGFFIVWYCTMRIIIVK